MEAGRRAEIVRALAAFSTESNELVSALYQEAQVNPGIRPLLGDSLKLRAQANMLARKVGAAVVAVRRAGAIHVFNSINHFFFIGQMIVPGSSYWNLGMGRQKGEVEKDDEGIKTMQDLGRNMAWLLKRLNTP